MTSITDQPIEEAVRDKAFAEMKNINENNICIDCEKKNPKWTSLHLGIYLCYDCAGKHRQYGVETSFVKSMTLDGWKYRQMLFMQKGGNSRALQYFRKKGVITAGNRTIDYKSQLVKQYKNLLTEQVDLQMAGGKKALPKEDEKKNVSDFFNELEQNAVKKQQKKIEIDKAEVVEPQVQKPKKKKDKKKIGARQINIQDFQSLAFDDGVPLQEKTKIVKQYEKNKDAQMQSTTESSYGSLSSQNATPTVKIQQPKELSEEQISKKMEELKLKTNLKNISSDSFKDNSIDNVVLKQNLNKFSGSSSISSSAFFNKEQQAPGGASMDKIKEMVSNVGSNMFSKLSGFLKK